MEEAKSNLIYLDTINIDKKYPYFLKNPNIDNNVYIVQRASSILNALYILDVWNREKFNIGEIDRYIYVNIPYTKYLYNSNNNIQEVKINDGDNNYKILVYKKDGKLYYSALLKFE